MALIVDRMGMKIALQTVALVVVLLSVQGAKVPAATKYSAKDPDIAAAVYGMLSFMIEAGGCTNGAVDQRGLDSFLKNAGLTAAKAKSIAENAMNQAGAARR